MPVATRRTSGKPSRLSPRLKETIAGNTVSGNQGSYGIFAAGRPAALYGNIVSGNHNASAVQLPSTFSQAVYNHNTYSGNKLNAMVLSGNVTATTSWPVSNSPYVLATGSGYTIINIGSTLTVESGSIIKFQASGPTSLGKLQVNSGGTLNATGAIFTSCFDDSSGGDTSNDGSATSPAPGNWLSI